jgi:hypothetical protein
MKSVLKIALASALVANSAFAMNFFAGASIGTAANTLKPTYTNTEEKKSTSTVNISSLNFGLEGGAVFNLADSFHMTAEAFVGFDMLNAKEKNYGYKAKNGISFGLQTKGMYAVSDNAKLYGLLGLGMMKMTNKVDEFDLSKNSLFASFGVGAEFMVMDNFGMYTEFAYVMPFSKLKETKEDKSALEVKRSQYQVKAGFRYFF